MLLHAVIVPPPSVLAEISRVLGSIDSRDAVLAPGTADRELDLIPPALMHLPIAVFGNVTAGDAARLVDTMTKAAAEWACPEVWLAGGGALESPDDRSVWAKLDGDVDALGTVARGIVKSVASRGFFVDRRRFKPWLAVATITATTTAAHLERVVAALDDVRGEPWTVAWVSVTKPSFGPLRGEFVEVYRIPLAPS